jgi:hypothetical protein
MCVMRRGGRLRVGFSCVFWSELGLIGFYSG